MSARSNTSRWAVISLLLVITCSRAFAGKTLYVDDDGPADFNNIQAAIDASVDGDTVLVAPGTYTGDGNRDIDFKGKAITVKSEEGPQNCIIDCQGSEDEPHRGFQFVSGEGRDSALSGLKIINGSGLEIKVSDWYRSVVAGAVLCLDSSPTISDCVIERNIAESDGWGGGIYCFNSSAAIINCIIQYNEAYAGGGIYCNGGSVVIDQCMLSSNISSYSGGSSGVTYTFRGCGGGICCLNSSTAITKSRIQNNKATNHGGGIHCNGGSVVIDQCIVSSNISFGGGGIFFDDGTDSVLNCLISNNLAYGDGGGILYNYTDADVKLDNCTVVRNLAYGGISPVGGVAPYRAVGSEKPIILTNCILWGNSGGGKCEYSTQVYLYSTALTLSYCCVQGWTPERGGDGNFGDDPLLTADFHLRADSPCINTGILNGSSNQLKVDIDGESREHSEQTDIGCDEYIDLDDDGLADFWELRHFETMVNIEAWQNPDEDQWTNIQEYHQSSNPVCPPTIFYVNALDGDDYWDGLSPVWDGQHGPKATIQAAINQASFYDHDNILLAPGTYTGDGNCDIDFKGKAITVKSEDGPETCIIDCNGIPDEPHRGFFFHSDEDANSVLQGITIINGYASQGGGILCQSASPNILDCLITANIATESGGGFKCLYSNPTVTRCIIRNNTAHNGGGVSSGRVVLGTGLNSLLTLTNCIVSGNKAESFGGGVICANNIILSNCTVFGNRAHRGGSIFFATVSGAINNSILYGNMASHGNEFAQIPPGVGGCYPYGLKITHSIVGSDPNAFDIPRCYIGEWLQVDPLFARPGYWDPNSTSDNPNDDYWVDGDYHLKSQAGRWDSNNQSWVIDDITSPGIDAGDPNSPIGLEPFPNGGRINIGAYGGTIEASKSYFGQPAKRLLPAT